MDKIRTLTNSSDRLDGTSYCRPHSALLIRPGTCEAHPLDPSRSPLLFRYLNATLAAYAESVY